MALTDNLKDHWVEVIEEYLTAAKMCLDTRKPDGGILGYPATLLLLCATDAIGHGLLPEMKKTHIRLDVLVKPPFCLKLHDDQIANLKKWYRNELVHSGLIRPGVYLKPDPEGEPFDFDTNGELRLIRVPILYGVVRDAWDRRDQTVFELEEPPDLSVPPPDFDSTNHSVSGVVFLPQPQGGKP